MKVGIVTHYYKSINYGGNLQAYALCKEIIKLGHIPEQLCVPIDYYENRHEFRSVKVKIKVRVYKLLDCIKHVKYHKRYICRKREVKKFNKNYIPHSKKIYSVKNIKEMEDGYDVLITGSDIVWNPRVHSPFFFLSYVTNSTPKFSYAASTGIDNFNNEDKNVFYKEFSSFQDISVREKSIALFFSNLMERKVNLCADPTLLLTKEEWDEICADRFIQHKYVFTYFLGSNTNAVNCAQLYAKKHGCKVVNIPYLSSRYKKNNDFGDIKLSNVSPQLFISLIKYAECTFTDSFHACVFSYIYNKKVFSFRRNETDNISVRIRDFLNLIGIEDHYCDSNEKENLEYLENIEKVQFNYDNKKIQELINSSIKYLTENLKKAEDRIKQK